MKDTDKSINLTDLLFAEFCKKEFGINRGVYNTIEKCFFEKGIENVLDRRRLILEFLNYVGQRMIATNKVKFGPGGLTKLLNLYWDNKRK
ncbi:hypothetical protein [Mesobacillus harenae]|uniref:hypothetical protein n=1 Tax=Mesobacillus harenae TaxID=2213203 RepID=UPI0015808024|nr:hypothetical protein [Mesobacillus harenae]